MLIARLDEMLSNQTDIHSVVIRDVGVILFQSKKVHQKRWNSQKKKLV